MRAISVLFRVAGLFVLLTVLLLIGGSTNVPVVAAQQRTCYRLVKTITCADDNKKDYCQSTQKLDFFGQADGSIIGKYQGGKTDECEIHVFPQQGKYQFICPSGSGEWNWQLPPETMCSDQDVSLSASMNFAGTGKLEARYWGNEAFQGRFEGGPSGGIGTVSGSNPFDWNTIEAQNSQGNKSGSISGLRPKEEMDKFSIGIVMTGFGIKPGGSSTDSVGFGIEYAYEPIPAGQEPPPGGQQTTGGQQSSSDAGGGQPAGGNADECTINTGSGIVINAVDNDSENKLLDCETRRVPFGDSTQDVLRCFSFRYTIPPGGITSAALHVVLIPGRSLQDTDSLSLAIGQANPDCDWAKGKMAGCVTLHGGFSGNEKCMNLDLLNAGCDTSIKISPEVQQAVTAQLQTGVLHFMLQDDTGIEGAQLVLNGGPTTFPCGVTETTASEAGYQGAQTSGGQQTSSGSTSGATLPMPTFGNPEPGLNVSGMTLQAGQRQVIAGSMALVPVWLIKSDNVANLNFDMGYDANVAKPEGTILQGNLLSGALFRANAEESGIIRMGFAQTNGVFGTGTVALVPFRAVGNPGDRTPLTLAVTTINNPNGSVPAINRIYGEIVIVGPDGLLQGDCDGDGRLTFADAMCALEISVKLRPPIQALDLDSNGDVTSRDAVLVMQDVLANIVR